MFGIIFAYGVPERLRESNLTFAIEDAFSGNTL